MNSVQQHQQYLVLGLGHSGLSALRWLRTQGLAVRVADSRLAPPNLATVQQQMPELEIHLGEFHDGLLDDVQCVVISPGLSLQTPLLQTAMQRGIEIVGDIELFARACPTSAKRIGITGSNGKTTVTSMVGEICQAAGYRTVVAGNIGLPVLDSLMDEEHENTEVFVLELSSFQLETTHSLSLDAAAMLNLSEDHLDRYADMQAYAAAKQRIFQHAKVQVLNRDDAASMAMRNPQQTLLSFSMQTPQHADEYGLRQVDGEVWLYRGEQALLAASELKVAGLHNAANALAAWALTSAIGINDEICAQALRQFKGLAHRVEWVANINGIDFYDDSKGTNVGATCAALHGFSGAAGKVVLIAGGDGKGQDFSPLRAAVNKTARAVVLIGRDAQQIAAVLDSNTQQVFSETLPAAVEQAMRLAQSKDCVLLSPACASFDMFDNYEHRAQVFVHAVHQLAKTQQGRVA